MAVYQIPTDGEGIHRAMYQTLTIDGNTFSVRIELQYFQRTDKWYLSIYDAVSGSAILTFIPLRSSAAGRMNDLLGQFEYLGMGSIFCFQASQDAPSFDPSGTSLGSWSLYWGDRYA